MFVRVIYDLISSRRSLKSIVSFSLLLLALSFPGETRAAQAVSASGARASQEVNSLQNGTAINSELSGGQEHIYLIELTEGQYARLVVEQRELDVTVRLLGIEGKVLAVFDDECRSRGEERPEIVAFATGSYRLSVRASSRSAPPGHYRIRVEEIRAATNNERLMQQARMLRVERNLAFLAGKYDDSRQFAERAVSIVESVLGREDPFLAALMGELAIVYDEKQDLAKAIPLVERGLAISEKALGDDHPRTIDMSRYLGWLYNEANEVAKAERLASRAAEMSEKAVGPDHFLVARCLYTLSAVTRDVKKRGELLHRALMIAEKSVGPDDYFIGVLLDAIGDFYIEARDFQRAEQFLLRATAIKHRVQGPDNIGLAVTLNSLGRIARERKDYGKAEERYARAIAIIQKAFGPDNRRLAIALNNLANVYRARGEYAKSLEAHHRVLRISETTTGPYHPLTLQSLGNIAKTYAAQGDIAEAIKFQSRVDSVIERNIGMNLAIGSERTKLNYLKSVAERTDRTISLNVSLAPDDTTASGLAALVLLQRKGRVLDSMSDSFAALRQRSTLEEQAMLKQFNDTTAELARLVLNGPQSMSFQEHQKKVGELEEQKERLETEISSRSAEFRAASQTVSLAVVRAAIPPNGALIEFAVYRPFDPKAENNSEAYKEPRYIAYVVRQKGEVRWRDLGDARAIDEAIGSLRQSLRDPLNRDSRERCRDVDEKVMKPVRELIGDASHLLISPDGALNLIPFEALVDEQGRYLIQRYLVTYLSSGRDLLRLAIARPAHSSSLVIADPFFGEPDLRDPAENELPSSKRAGTTSATDLSSVYFAPLAGTALEARAIKSLFPDVTTLLQRQATESLLKRSAGPRILHIATHGFFLTDGPPSQSPGENLQATRAISVRARVENPLLRSGLALAGANLRRSSSSDDGILTALEASGLNLWGTKLVTLSACDTGLGEVKNGEGVYGLRRAFVLAGTETLVMSLWPVSDYVARELMTHYYSGLRQGLGRGEALRQVQLDMLKRKNRQHPFYWASFIQSGEWANLDGKR
ncbi:MAG TPA: CHAT domain-containing tetratricopeptide repeat protein [Blastocatellia bacterium]|nr:CHAT domain-containing tetratricopeptide repeat protein [Blastocatellia bacterium]